MWKALWLRLIALATKAPGAGLLYWSTTRELGSGWSRPDEEQRVRLQIVGTGRLQLGAKYQLGAENDGLAAAAVQRQDCSELTQTCYALPWFQRQLPDGAERQYHFCRKRGYPTVPGDLLFLRYESQRTPGRVVWHVGIATGEGTVVHASASRGEVVEEPIEKFLNHEGYLGAGRHPEFAA